MLRPRITEAAQQSVADQGLPCRWAEAGECQVNPYFMRKECSVSCHICTKLPFAQKPWQGWAGEWDTKFWATRQVHWAAAATFNA